VRARTVSDSGVRETLFRVALHAGFVPGLAARFNARQLDVGSAPERLAPDTWVELIWTGEGAASVSAVTKSIPASEHDALFSDPSFWTDVENRRRERLEACARQQQELQQQPVAAAVPSLVEAVAAPPRAPPTISGASGWGGLGLASVFSGSLISGVLKEAEKFANEATATVTAIGGGGAGPLVKTPLTETAASAAINDARAAATAPQGEKGAAPAAATADINGIDAELAALETVTAAAPAAVAPALAPPPPLATAPTKASPEVAAVSEAAPAVAPPPTAMAPPPPAAPSSGDDLADLEAYLDGLT
jgi:hypothetical protein